MSSFTCWTSLFWSSAQTSSVLGEQHVPIFDLVVEVLQDPDDSGSLRGSPVRRDGHKVELKWQPYVSRQIRHEDEGPLQHADKKEVVLAPVIPCDLSGQAPDALLDIFPGDQDAIDGVFVIRHVRGKSRNGFHCGRMRIDV